MTLMEPFEAAALAASRLARLTGTDGHDVAVVLGSGWAAAADALGPVEAEIGFDDLPGFPPTGVAGHPGRVRSARVGGLRVLVLLGRVHLYEGHPPSVVVHGVRMAARAGCRTVVLTNAAGAVRADLQVGRPVLISDHINLTGRSPLEGPPPPAPNPARFCDMTTAYPARLRDLARQVDPSVGEGVYAALLGPSYETPAEIRMLRTLGADLVGMSTALETVAAVHMGAEVLGISLVTNLAAGLSPAPLEHSDVVAVGGRAAVGLGELLRGVIDRLSPTP